MEFSTKIDGFELIWDGYNLKIVFLNKGKMFATKEYGAVERYRVDKIIEMLRDYTLYNLKETLISRCITFLTMLYEIEEVIFKKQKRGTKFNPKIDRYNIKILDSGKAVVTLKSHYKLIWEGEYEDSCEKTERLRKMLFKYTLHNLNTSEISKCASYSKIRSKMKKIICYSNR